jgi:glycosyltransferase involved in cell wall biosynthesis
MISILIPIFNAENTVKQTIESCYEQTFKDFEIIAVNDQSTDNTQSILDEYKDRPNFKILNTKDVNNKGIVAALNYGISNASGEYIARLDADDFMDPRRLELQSIEFLRNPDLLLCSTDARIVDENGSLINICLSSTDDLDELDYKCCIVHPTVMWKKNFFDNNKLLYDKEFEYAEDYDLWFRFRKIAGPNSYKHISIPLLFYRISGKDRISSIKNDKQRSLSKKIREKYHIKPYLSIINLGDKDTLEKELSFKDFNYEVISPKEEPKGKFIAYSKYENANNRFDIQIQILNKNKKLVGCGTFINTGKHSFFYSPDPNVIENELLKGKIAIEQNTFLFRNCLKDYRNLDYFNLLCNLLFYGMYTNVQQPLVKIEDYKGITNTDIANKIKIARTFYSEIINIVQVNITSEGNFSGVDRYLKTLEDNYPSNVRLQRITLRAGNKLEFDMSDSNHAIIYYNTGKTQLEHLYDTIWDNVSYMFVNKRNLIVQSNCFNLYTFLTFLRQKVAFKHICMLHCVPYRELIRTNRDEYAKKEAEYFDTNREFTEIPWHYSAVNLADYSIVNTKDSEDYYNRVGYATPYSVIYNGIEKIGKGVRKHKEGEPFRFIFVGHSSPLKGLDQLLPIIEEINKQYSIEVFWVGAADKSLCSIIEQKKLPIKIFGVISPEVLNDLYKQVDAALIATACETCSYAAIEALSAELPIIATRAHGVTEIVENVGFLVNMNIRAEIDRDMYKSAMIKVITEPETRKEMSLRAKERFKWYTKENLVDKSVKLYKKLLNV